MADIVRQNGGFIVNETQRARDDMARARSYREQGNTTAAKSYETRAETHIVRANAAAQTIMKRTGK